MKYNNVYIDAMGYELGPVVVTSIELEERLGPLYKALHIPLGQLEALTGIAERRWWEPNYRLSKGAVAAAKKALAKSNVTPQDIGSVIYAGVNRENFEPATACAVAAELGIGENASVYDITNACLGVLNGMLEVANRIELGQIRAGLIVSCETAREIVELTMDKMLEIGTMDFFKTAIATLTGGSGACAILLTDGSFGAEPHRKLAGGVAHAAPQHHGLCLWGLQEIGHQILRQFMATDAVSVLRHGVELGVNTWRSFLGELNWTNDLVDKLCCHQVGAANQKSILESIRMPIEKDFATFEFLGNMGTVSLPMTAAIAEEREFLIPGDRVAFLGIGSGLNCMMLGVEW